MSLGVWHQAGACGLAAKNVFNVLIFDVNGPVTKSYGLYDESLLAPTWKS